MATQRNRKGTRRSPHSAVSLVSMPFKDLRHPPIQLGILQRCLERQSISVRSHSLELLFMDHLYGATCNAEEGAITISDYQGVATRDFVVNLGDWIFKVPPYATRFPDRQSTDDDYLAFARESGTTDAAISVARRMRALVPRFLEIAATEILAGQPRIVGFSSVFQQNVASLVLSMILKERDPSLTIVFGGGNCDGPMGRAIHESFPWVDVVVRGEGERVLLDVVSDVLAGKSIRPQSGLCYRDDGRSVAVPQASGPQVPLAEVPTPTYDEYFARLERSPLRNELWPDVAVLFESSRGCWWGAKSHCTFCGLNSNLMAFRSKPAGQVADEIVELAERYKVLDFVAVDDIIDLRHIRDFLPLLAERGYDFTLFYETKANLTKNQIRAFKRAGVDAIQPGIESLSTPILSLMRKGVTALQNIRLLKWCAEIGVTPAWNLLWGFPGEPPDEYDRMADLLPSLIHLKPPSFMPMQVERFSPYFERPADFGLQLTGPEAQYRFLYPLQPEGLADIAYDFGHRYDDGRDPTSYSARLGEAVRQWRDASASAAGSLTYRSGPGFIQIEDRRPALEHADYRLDGTEAKIYLNCDGGATPAELAKLVAAEGDDSFDEPEIRDYLQELLEARLVYREGSRYLSLAIAQNGRTKSEQGTPRLMDRPNLHRCCHG